MKLKWLLWAPISAVFPPYRQQYALLLSVLGTSFQYVFMLPVLALQAAFSAWLCPQMRVWHTADTLNRWMNEWILLSQMLEDLWTFLTKNNMVKKCLQNTYFLMLFKMAIDWDFGILLLGTFLNKQIQRLILFLWNKWFK